MKEYFRFMQDVLGVGFFPIAGICLVILSVCVVLAVKLAFTPLVEQTRQTGILSVTRLGRTIVVFLVLLSIGATVSMTPILVTVSLPAGWSRLLVGSAIYPLSEDTIFCDDHAGHEGCVGEEYDYGQKFVAMSTGDEIDWYATRVKATVYYARQMLWTLTWIILAGVLIFAMKAIPWRKIPVRW